MDHLKKICELDGNDTNNGKKSSLRQWDKLVSNCVDFIGANMGVSCRSLNKEHLDDALVMIWDETLAASRLIVSSALKVIIIGQVLMPIGHIII
jgi:hypothetical protein